jgi:hypothetical protein
MIKRVLGTMLSVCIAASLFGCKSDSVDTLLGSYGAQESGKLQPVVKVEKTNAGYVIDDYVSGNGRAETEVAAPMTKEDFEKLTGANVSGEFFWPQNEGCVGHESARGISIGEIQDFNGVHARIHARPG